MTTRFDADSRKPFFQHLKEVELAMEAPQQHQHVKAFFRKYRAEGKLARTSLAVYDSYLRLFFGWAKIEPEKISGDVVQDYLEHMIEKGLALPTRAVRLAALKTFTHFMATTGILQVDPLAGLEHLRVPKGLPKPIAPEKVAALLAAPDTSTEAGLRDRAMLEMFYGSGLRVSECVGINFEDLDLDNREVRVLGKGNKERLTPMSQSSVTAVREYVKMRGAGRSSDPVFLGVRNRRRVNPNLMDYRIKYYAGNCGVPLHQLTPHKLRHSFATHLYDGGADIRVIQDLLGHASLATTEIYTKVSQKKRMETFRQCHPRDRMEIRPVVKLPLDSF